MSAILGRVEFGPKDIIQPHFVRTLSKLKKYGAGSASHQISGPIAIGCQALGSGADSSSPACFRSNGDLLLVADAILDNREELANALEISHSKLALKSDADLIFSSILRWGEDCVEHLEGDYAFAYIQLRDRRIVLVRDHIGTRPLYWARRGKTFVFCTFVEGLVGFEDFKWAIDEAVIAEYLAVPFAPVSKSFFADIQSVPAGSILKVTDRDISIKRWWEPSIKESGQFTSDRQVVAECRRLLERAIEVRTQTTKAVGSHISGGIDSTGVTMIALNVLKARERQLVGAYAWCPPITDQYPAIHAQDERLFIQSLADREQIPITFGSGDTDNFLSFLNKFPYAEIS